MKFYKIEKVKQNAISIFTNFGLSFERATELTDHLMYAELRGISSHGFVRVKWILEQLHKYPQNSVQMLLRQSSNELYDAKNMLGYLALADIIDQQKSSQYSKIKMIGVRNTYPTGALSYYAEKLSSKGWIVLMSSTSPRRVGLLGDNAPLVGTNPWTFALPITVSSGGYVVVDVSLAEVTHGQCLKLVSTGEPLPKFAATQPGGRKIQTADDLWKGGEWNAIIHPIGHKKSYKSFGVLWSLQIMGSRMLGLNDNEYGTFILLMSPALWEPIVSKEEVLAGLTEEVELLRQSKVAHVPGEGRIKRSIDNSSTIQLDNDIALMLKLEEMLEWKV